VPGGARRARDLARRFGLDMPIVDAVHRVLFEDVPPRTPCSRCWRASRVRNDDRARGLGVRR
jgi:glycerol-3-phosphate dehydrogenase